LTSPTKDDSIARNPIESIEISGYEGREPKRLPTQKSDEIHKFVSTITFCNEICDDMMIAYFTGKDYCRTDTSARELEKELKKSEELKPEKEREKPPSKSTIANYRKLYELLDEFPKVLHIDTTKVNISTLKEKASQLYAYLYWLPMDEKMFWKK
jgi:hypothetical protein